MSGLQKPEIKLVELDNDNNFGRFEIAPLERGFGHTIGNSLRRVLLSSLPGCAITSIKVDGAMHEFSTVDGIVEDMVEIILNLKKIRLRFAGDETKLHLKLKEGEVFAGDIEGAEILNPELLICTVSNDTNKVIEMEATRGFGYQDSTVNAEAGDTIIGKIYIDSIFSPVAKASYSVEPTRVGEKSGYDKIILEVTTDLTVTPKQALADAINILMQHYGAIQNVTELEVAAEVFKEEEEVIEEVVEERTILELNLQTRSYNSLKRHGINKVSELTTLTLEDLEKIPNLGQKSVDDILETLKKHNLTLTEN